MVVYHLFVSLFDQTLLSILISNQHFDLITGYYLRIGIAQCAELTWQLRGSAGDRQVPNCKLALQHNIGLGGAAVVALYKMAVEPKVIIFISLINIIHMFVYKFHNFLELSFISPDGFSE